MKRRFLQLRWTSIFNPHATLICVVFATIAAAHAQIRTITRQPYPAAGDSVAWITNVPCISGAGIQQQLDLFVLTNRKNMPLIVYVHGGGYGHGDKFGDSLNPDALRRQAVTGL